MNPLPEWPVFDLNAAEKQAALWPRLQALTRWHAQRCEPYRKLLAGLGDARATASDLHAMPYVTARLFKWFELRSVPIAEITKWLTSSGTTSSQVSRLALDRQTAADQSRVLVRILQPVLGKARLPMLLCEPPPAVGRQQLSARGAGVQGVSLFSRERYYALDGEGNWDLDAIRAFAARVADQPGVIFGFTFMVWELLEYLEQYLEREGERVTLPAVVLLHTGGWKKLADRAVDNDSFKRRARAVLGLQRVHNFYGMAEQTGSVFLECSAGHLHASSYSDVVMRDPLTLQPLGPGHTGVVEVASALPLSYPGHLVLTEDLGRWLGEDDCACGWKGRYFEIQGRLPRAELRGCSDVGG